MGFCVLLGLCNRVPHWFGGWVIVFCLIVSFCRVISVYWTKPKATHAFSPNILTLSTSLAAHLYLPTLACIWLSLSVGAVLTFYFWFHQFIRFFYSDVSKIFKSSSKHWYLIHRVLSNNVVLCLLRVPRHHLSSCFLILLLAVPVHLCAGVLCICYWWTPFLMVISVALVQSFWNAGNYLELYFCYIFCNTSFCISLAFWPVKSLLDSYSYDLLVFSFLLKWWD